MTAIILFEGIPTSGKSVLIQKVNQILKSKQKSVEIITDEEIIKPFIERNDLTDRSPIINAQEHLKLLLRKKLLKKPQVILSHNFHLFYLSTNNSRGKKETLLQDYQDIESMLEVYPTLLVFLEIENRYILPCFHKRFAMYEKEGRTDFFKTVLEAKGSSFAQVAYYQKKQNLYKEQLKKTKVYTLNLLIKKETLYYDLAQKIVKKMSEIEGGFNQ